MVMRKSRTKQNLENTGKHPRWTAIFVKFFFIGDLILIAYVFAV